MKKALIAAGIKIVDNKIAMADLPKALIVMEAAKSQAKEEEHNYKGKKYWTCSYDDIVEVWGDGFGPTVCDDIKQAHEEAKKAIDKA